MVPRQKKKEISQREGNLFDTAWISNIKWYYILISGLLAWTQLHQQPSCLMLIYLLGIYLISFGFFPHLIVVAAVHFISTFFVVVAAWCSTKTYQSERRYFVWYLTVCRGEPLFHPSKAVSQLCFGNKSNGFISQFLSPPLEHFQDISMLPFSSHCEHHSSPCVECTRLHLKQDCNSETMWTIFQGLITAFKRLYIGSVLGRYLPRRRDRQTTTDDLFSVIVRVRVWRPLDKQRRLSLGPVEGVKQGAGDTLAVTLSQVRLSRAWVDRRKKERKRKRKKNVELKKMCKITLIKETKRILLPSHSSSQCCAT